MTLTKLAAAGALAGALTLAGIVPVFAQDVAADAPIADVPAADAPVVPMQGNAFNPPQLEVPVGATLTWVNNDGEDHDVVPSDPNFSLDLSFFSPAVAPGSNWSFTFTVPGTYDYMCDLHANMSGQIVVS